MKDKPRSVGIHVEDSSDIDIIDNNFTVSGVAVFAKNVESLRAIGNTFSQSDFDTLAAELKTHGLDDTDVAGLRARWTLRQRPRRRQAPVPLMIGLSTLLRKWAMPL